MKPSHRAPWLLLLCTLLSALTVGCLSGGARNALGTDLSTDLGGSLQACATVASNGEDAFNLDAEGSRSEQMPTAPPPVSVSIAPDPLDASSPALIIEVQPDVQGILLSTLSVGGGEAALFSQGGALSPQQATRKLWTRSATSASRWVIPLAALWPSSGPRGILALELESEVTGQPLHRHRQLLSAAPFSISAHRDGATLYSQIKPSLPGANLNDASQPDAFTVEVLDDQGRTLAQGRATADGTLKLSHPLFAHLDSRDLTLFIIARRGVERAFAVIQR
jgi:hypothetical protein